jgi:acetyl esterase/lipase
MIYSPEPEAALPVMIFFHGGGHMCGSTDLYDPMCRKIALASRCVVISVDYRLTPEHPYPAGLQDAEYIIANYRQVLEDVTFNYTLLIAGDSAGGAICSTLSMKQAEGADFGIHKQILIYPSVDYTMSQASIEDNGVGFFLEKERIAWYLEHYFSRQEDRKAASPLFGTMNESMPETMIIVAGCDPLRDEGLAYGERLAETGVKVRVHQFDGMIHAFMNIEDLVPEECKQLYQHIADFIAG